MQIKYIKKNTLESGFVPPEAFLYLDKNGFIQNENEIPVLYHIYRRCNIKLISHNQLTVDNARFDTSIYIRDKNMIPNLNLNKYWWLTE